MNKRCIYLSFCLTAVTSAYGFDDVREVYAEMMEIWRDMVFSADRDDDAIKSLAATYWESFPEESKDDKRLKKMLANAFKGTFGVTPDQVELSLPRFITLANTSKQFQDEARSQLTLCQETLFRLRNETEIDKQINHKVQDQLVSCQETESQQRQEIESNKQIRDQIQAQLASCQEITSRQRNETEVNKQIHDQVQVQLVSCQEAESKQRKEIKEISFEKGAVDAKIDQLSQSMKKYGASKEHVEHLHTAYKNVLKRKGSVEDQRKAAIELKKAWDDYETSHDQLNGTFTLFNIPSALSIDERTKRTMTGIFDLYDKFFDSGSNE